MTITNKPETTLIEQLNAARTALAEERQSLVDRIQTIDEALGAAPSAKSAQKATKGTKTIGTPRAGGLKEAVITAVTGSNLTIREIQTLLSEHSPKSVESVVHSLASAGNLTKDNSSPKKFSLAAVPEQKAKTNGSAARPVGAVANGA